MSSGDFLGHPYFLGHLPQIGVRHGGKGRRYRILAQSLAGSAALWLKLGRSLPDLWSGGRQRGAQQHGLRDAVHVWAHRYGPRTPLWRPPTAPRLSRSPTPRWGLLPADRRPNWYDPGTFWSGDDLELLAGASLDGEIEVEVPPQAGP